MGPAPHQRHSPTGSELPLGPEKAILNTKIFPKKPNLRKVVHLHKLRPHGHPHIRSNMVVKSELVDGEPLLPGDLKKLRHLLDVVEAHSAWGNVLDALGVDATALFAVLLVLMGVAADVDFLEFFLLIV